MLERVRFEQWHLVLAVLCVVFVGGPARQAHALTCYAVADDDDVLTQVDETDASQTLIGTTTGAGSIEALAIDPSTGVVYAANASQLGTLDTGSGAFSALGSFGTGSGPLGNITFTDVDGLGFSGTSGILYGAHRRGGSDVLLQINTATGAHVAGAFGGDDYLVVSAGSYSEIDDLAIDPISGTVYAAANTGGGNDMALVTIDLTTGIATTIGDFETSGGTKVDDMEGLGIAPNGVLYGSTGANGAAATDNRLWEVSKSTGIVTLIGAFSPWTDYEAFDCNSEPAPTPTSTPTKTTEPTATATNTVEPTATATPVATDTPTIAVPTSTATATATAEDTPTPNSCGNGIVDGGEECDDGNLVSGDGCESDCTFSAECDFDHGGTPVEVFVNDGTGNDAGATPAGCASAGFATIQAAIDDASVNDGDIVSVCPGSYTESVSITKEITVRSTDGAATTSLTSSGIAFDVRRSAVTIEGFTVQAANAAVSASSICPLSQASCGSARGSNLTIADNTIESSPLGIAWQSKIDCAVIDRNTMTANDTHIDIEQTSGAPALSVTILLNDISGGGSSGRSVRLAGLGAQLAFLGNTVDGSAGSGVVVENLAPGPAIQENNITNNAVNGVLMLPGTAGTQVLQNNIEDNGVGLRNLAPGGVVDATINWWGSQTGPFHATDRPSAVGDEIIDSTAGGLDTDFIEFLCAPAPGGFPSVNGECNLGEPEVVDFVAFGREPDVSSNGRFITFVSANDLNGDQRVTIDNADEGDEIFLLNRRPTKPSSYCLGGTQPGAPCHRQRDCPADFDADPIITDGVCVLLTQLSNDPVGAAQSSSPRVTRSGNVFFGNSADLIGANPDGSQEIYRWSRRDFRRNAPLDPNTILDVYTHGDGIDSKAPAPDVGGRRRVVMESGDDPLGGNGDGNMEIFVLDIKRDVWTQITDTTGADNRRPSTQNGRQILFDSEADLTGQNPDGNREIFYAKFRRQAWGVTQITHTVGVENRAGNLSKRGKVLVFTSNGDLVSGQNADGNREVFLWNKGVFEQVTHTTVGENTNAHSNKRGRFVTFESTANAEGDGATLTNRRVHLHDRKFGTTKLISRSFFGENTAPRLSQGRFIVWESTANLTGQNPDAKRAVYLFDRRRDD